jgi:hypothetical protein
MNDNSFPKTFETIVSQELILNHYLMGFYLKTTVAKSIEREID